MPEPITKSRDHILHLMASLDAAISILERTPRAKKAVASDRMFDQMIEDYKKALDNARKIENKIRSESVTKAKYPEGYLVYLKSIGETLPE